MSLACPTGKLRYPSQASAYRAVARMAARNRGPRADAYRCPECDAWHMTSLPRDHADGIRARARRRSA